MKTSKKKKNGATPDSFGPVEVPGGFPTKTLGEIAESAYTRFGEYANCHRQLPDVRDGIKVSYRRVLTMAMSHPPGKHVATSTLLGELNALHPHSTSGCEDMINNFVHTGILEGDGNFGEYFILDKDIVSSAAPRYTKVAVSQRFREILGDLLKDVPWHDSPMEKKEPDYIPTPLPLCFSLKYRMQGLGVAIKTEIPSFGMASMYRALMADDPSLLEPGIDLIMDKDRSELERIWTTGTGKITYSYHLARVTGDDGKTEGILFYGDTGVFQVKLGKTLTKLQEEGKILVDNVSDQSGPKMLISRVPGARGVTIEDIAREAERICSNTTLYSLNVTDGKSAFRIPLREWLRYTYQNYLDLLRFSVDKKIVATEFDLQVVLAGPVVAEEIMADPGVTDKAVSAKLGIPIEVVQEVFRKPIGSLRKTRDNTARLKALKARLKALKSFDPVKFTENQVGQLL